MLMLGGIVRRASYGGVYDITPEAGAHSLSEARRHSVYCNYLSISMSTKGELCVMQLLTEVLTVDKAE